jgi:hypothetical protein
MIQQNVSLDAIQRVQVNLRPAQSAWVAASW